MQEEKTTWERAQREKESASNEYRTATGRRERTAAYNGQEKEDKRLKRERNG